MASLCAGVRVNSHCVRTYCSWLVHVLSVTHSLMNSACQLDCGLASKYKHVSEANVGCAEKSAMIASHLRSPGSPNGRLPNTPPQTACGMEKLRMTAAVVVAFSQNGGDQLSMILVPYPVDGSVRGIHTREQAN